MTEADKWAERGRWLVDKLSERWTPNGYVLELTEEDIYIQPEGTLADYIAAVDQAMERDESYLPNT